METFDRMDVVFDDIRNVDESSLLFSLESLFFLFFSVETMLTLYLVYLRTKTF